MVDKENPRAVRQATHDLHAVVVDFHGLAVLLQAPIVLVIDAAGMAASVGALVRGFRTYDPEVHIAGVILNRLGGEGHYRYLTPALSREGVELLGYLPKDAELGIPERHLGLLPAAEEDRVTPLLERLIALTERHVDLPRVIQLAHSAPPLQPVAPLSHQTPSRRIRVAWAQPGGTRMTDQLQQFGYAEATFLQDTLLGPAGTTVRGHRFHYSVYEPGPVLPACAYRITRARTGET
jgi:cobyrinic acid a,c-diamide synthase